MRRTQEGTVSRGNGGEPNVPPLVHDIGQIISQAILMLDRAGTIVWMNDAALHLHGLDWPAIQTIAEYDARFSFRNVNDMMPEANPFARVLQGKAITEADYNLVALQGRGVFRCRIRAKPTWADDGSVSGGIVVMEDVTDEHQNSEQRKTLLVRERLARTAAERERDFVQRIFDAAPIAAIVFEGPDHRLTFMNQAAAELTRVRPGNDHTHAEVFPSDHPHVESLLSAVYRGANPHARLEREYQLPGGAVILQSHYVPLPGPEGRPLGVVWLALDITARRRAELGLESARRQLSRSERMSALGALVSGVAHELRTPLAYIMNNLAIARRRIERSAPSQTPELVAPLDEAMDGAERINRIVGELRKFGDTAPATFRVSLDEVVRPAVELFRATHVGPVVVAVDLRSVAQVEVDVYQMQQVALNLLQNAAEAMPGGGTVRIRTEDGPSSARLVVQDEGHGIPETARARIFDEFFTTKPMGTGLGLSIVRRIVQLHRGRISFETGERGTTFFVEFPTPPRDAR